MVLCASLTPARPEHLRVETLVHTVLYIILYVAYTLLAESRGPRKLASAVSGQADAVSQRITAACLDVRTGGRAALLYGRSRGSIQYTRT